MTDLISKSALLASTDKEEIHKYEIALFPTIDPVKHGTWMPHPTEPDWDVCSACGIGTMRRTHGYDNGAFWDAEESYSYCPHCGARMSEANDEAD